LLILDYAIPGHAISCYQSLRDTRTPRQVKHLSSLGQRLQTFERLRRNSHRPIAILSWTPFSGSPLRCSSQRQACKQSSLPFMTIALFRVETPFQSSARSLVRMLQRSAVCMQRRALRFQLHIYLCTAPLNEAAACGELVSFCKARRTGETSQKYMYHMAPLHAALNYTSVIHYAILVVRGTFRTNTYTYIYIYTHAYTLYIYISIYS